MANKEHLARLREGVEAWNSWRAENHTIRPNLFAANLIGALWSAKLSLPYSHLRLFEAL